MIYQHPLAYLIGVEGIALLRAFGGEYDREFTRARLAEIRVLLDAADALGEGGTATPGSVVDGYNGWAPFYDHQGNGLIEAEQPVVREILAGLPVGVALDAACGTGRHAEYLHTLGHRVIGVDASPGMLAVARAKLPDVELHEGDLHRLPLPDRSVDTVVCALALNHVPELPPVFAEFARVLRPGGHLVISDSRNLVPGIPMPLVRTAPDLTSTYMANRDTPTSRYLSTALRLGFQVRRCEELTGDADLVGADGVPPGAGPDPGLVPGTPPNIWSLHVWAASTTTAAGLGSAADAINAAYRRRPGAIIWHFQRDAATTP